MAYTTVYSPDGKKFEVASRDRADKLILQDGWTQTKPVIEKKKAEPKKPLRRKTKVEPISEPTPFSSMFNKPAEKSGDET